MCWKGRFWDSAIPKIDFTENLCNRKILKRHSRKLISRNFSDEDKEDSELTDEEKQQKAIDAAIKEIMERFACILVTQPLHVVTVRAMASFVGNEQEYNGILEGLKTIYRENGILGFWSGMMPRALGEALTIAIGAGLTFLLNQYVEPSMKAHTSMIAGKF